MKPAPSTGADVLFPLSNTMLWSSKATVVELTVVVVPSTCRFPRITTNVSSSASPIFNVSFESKVAKTDITFALETLSTSVLPARAVEDVVPNANKAVSPAKAVPLLVPNPGNEVFPEFVEIAVACVLVRTCAHVCLHRSTREMLKP